MRKVYPVSLLACLLLTLSASAQPKSQSADHRPLLVCFGDSLTASPGVDPGQSYPDDLQTLLDQRHIRYRVDNQGVSGNTTKDGVQRLPQVLALHPAVAVVEFGGNDGLRGLPIADTRANLDRIVATLQHSSIKVALAGITLPPDYGPDYIHAFEQVFRDLAAEHRAAFVPMIYKDLVRVPGTIQPDGIHPTAKGSDILAETLFSALKPLLHK